MNKQQYQHIQNDHGFIAALDQSGGSTPKTLGLYGVKESDYSSEEQMYALVHEMRTRVILSPAFSSEYILGAILFEDTMNRKIENLYTADYLWNTKGIVPFLKIDKGLADEKNGVQLMKAMPELDNLLKEAVKKNVFGTKMRSLIKKADAFGIKEVVKQQFEVAKQILSHGLVPIVEPEIDIHAPDKLEAEKILKRELEMELNKLPASSKVMLKISIPTEANFYESLMKNGHVLRIVALSGGYSQEEANQKLKANHNLIASFSRTLLHGLTKQQSDKEFNQALANSIKGIYQASIS